MQPHTTVTLDQLAKAFDTWRRNVLAQPDVFDMSLIWEPTIGMRDAKYLLFLLAQQERTPHAD